jgi:hypothetical protein
MPKILGIDLGTTNRMRKNLNNAYVRDVEKIKNLKIFLMFLDLSLLKEKILKNKILISDNQRLLYNLIPYKQNIINILKNHYFNNIFSQINNN